MEKVRCPSCRGAKKMAKLGGVIGECNTCDGEGKIDACDKVAPAVESIAAPITEVIKAVSESVPVSDLELKRNSVYKRKTIPGGKNGTL